MKASGNSIRVAAVPTRNRNPFAQDRSLPDACGFVRMLGPMMAMAPAGHPGLYLGLDNFPVEAIRTCDVVWANRSSLLQSKNASAILEFLKAGNKPLLLDIDDALFDIEADHNESDHYDRLRHDLKQLLSVATLVSCSTPGVERSVKEVTGTKTNTRLVRNSILRSWFVSDAAGGRQDRRIEVCYYGTSTHGPDWAHIESQIVECALQFTGRARFTLLGVVSSDQAARWPANVRSVAVPPSAALVYPNFMSYIADTIRPDVVICPLMSSKFNEAKSELKVLEAIALQAIPMFSAGFEYDNIGVHDSMPALRVADRDWHVSLNDVLTHLDDYKSGMAAVADDILQRYDAARTADLLSQLLLECRSYG